MKIVNIFKKLSLYAILIFVVFFLGIIIFLKTYDLNRLKPQIVQAINQSSGLDLTIDKINFEFLLKEGATLNLNKILIKDPPAFGKGNIIEAQRISIHLDILASVVNRKIISSQIKIVSPVLQLQYNENKELNLDQLILSIKEERLQDEYSDKQVKNKKPASSRISKVSGSASGQGINVTTLQQKEFNEKGFRGMPEILIDEIKVENGTLNFKSGFEKSSAQLPIENISFVIKSFSFNDSFSFTGSWSCFSETENMRLQGNAIVNKSIEQIRFDDVQFSLSLSCLSLDLLKKIFPSVQNTAVESFKSGNLSFFINQMILGAEGLLVLSADGRISDVRLGLFESAYPMNTFNGSFEITQENLHLTELIIRIASGEIKVKGEVSDYLKDQEYSFDLRADAVSMKELLYFTDLDYDMEGTFKGILQLSGQSLIPEFSKETMKGQGFIDAKGLVIKDMNFLKLALEKVPDISHLHDRIQENLPERIKEKLKKKDTEFEKVQLDISVQAGEVFLKDSQINTADFMVQSTGKLTFNDQLSLETDFFLNQDISKNLIEGIREFACLANEEGEIYIRMQKYSGPLSRMKIYPDIKSLVKRMGKCQIKDELRKIIQGDTTNSDESSQKSILIPAFEEKDVPIDPIIDKAIDIFNDLF